MNRKIAANESGIDIIDLTPENIANYGVCGYKDVNKHEELKRKIHWFTEYYPKGLRISALISKTGGYQGMIEYIPGEFAHRPVSAKNYMFIHCIFVGFKKEFKGKGYASLLIDKCIEDAKSGKMHGVAVVTRDGSFMAKKDIFLKKGFVQCDTSAPDFQLMALKFREDYKNPKFNQMSIPHDANDLTIIRSAQCPYSVKNVEAIMNTAQGIGLKPKLVEIKTATEAQNVPCAFGTFCILYKGNVLSYHPISNTRFENIMKKL